MKDKQRKAVMGAAFLLTAFLLITSTSCRNQSAENTAGNQQTVNDTLPQADSVITMEKLNQQIRDNPLNPDLFASRAALHALAKNFNQAQDDIQLALKLDSLKPEYYIMQAEYYIYNGQPNSATKGLNDCLRLFPNNTEVMLKLAEIHFYLKEYSRAQLLLQDVTLLNDDLAQIYFLNGLIFLENGDTVNAVNNLRFSTEKDPDNYPAYVMLGRIHAGQMNELAETYYRSALDIDPASYESRYNLAMFLQEAGDIEEALIEYEYLISEVDSTQANPYYNLGYIHLIYLADFEQAEEWFTEAIIRDSAYVDAWYNRGFSREVMGELKKAREDYEHSLELNTNYPLSIKGLNRIDQGEPFKYQ